MPNPARTTAALISLVSPGVDLAHQGVPRGRLRQRMKAVAHVGLDEVQPRERFHVGVRSVVYLFQLKARNAKRPYVHM